MDGDGSPVGGEIALVVLEIAVGVSARLWHGSTQWLTLRDMLGIEGMMRRINLPLVKGRNLGMSLSLGLVTGRCS